MNKVILIGRLTRDPELRQTPTGVSNCQFSIAVNRNFKNRDGVTEADFFNVIVWNKPAENIARYCSKGTQVCVEGRLQTRNYDGQDGTKRYVTEVIASNVEFLSPKGAISNSLPNEFMDSSNNFDYSDMPAVPETDIPKEDPFKDFGSEVSLSDDDLPF